MPRSFSRMATLSPRVVTRCQNRAGTVSKPSSSIGCAICTFMFEPSAPSCRAHRQRLVRFQRFLPRTAVSFTPEVELAHVLVLDELGAGPFQHDAPDLQHIAVVRRLERHVGVLLDQQHGDVLLLVEAADDGEDLLDQDRRQPQRRLVEQHQLGPGHQRPPDRQHLLLAARQEACLRALALAQDREVGIDDVEVALDVGAVAAGVGAHHQVALDRHEREDLAPLRHMGDALPRHPVGLAADDAAAAERDRALLRLHGPAHRFQHRGLAGAVGAQDGDDLALGARRSSPREWP